MSVLKKSFLLVLAALGLAVPAALAATSWHLVGSSQAGGPYAVSLTRAATKAPRAMEIRLYAAPRQKATITWSVTCSKGAGSQRNSGVISLRLPATLPLPLPPYHSSSCLARSATQLNVGGTLRVSIYAKR